MKVLSKTWLDGVVGSVDGLVSSAIHYWDRLWIHHHPNQDKAINVDELMNSSIKNLISRRLLFAANVCTLDVTM